ncbi:hypothetical protein [Natrialba swarupiae]|uniref:Uncharacterized protein n=1 Tax=Natrialba swarupiae TaxID=2448032 RepID=A0A5D5AYA6_9EURY|nr:hypothetical protein [Natrialba swarupiae]MCW8173200.1 hypothetical protein [Natrialba swarupiae]TYT63931.1 hypothetical protein FYC77_01610 [Natrialba swarupiae]
MSTHFRTAMKSNVTHDHRRAAIDRLIERGERQNLAIVVETAGLRGEFRRQALEGLAACRATDELEALAEETSLDRSLRRRADELT